MSSQEENVGYSYPQPGEISRKMIRSFKEDDDSNHQYVEWDSDGKHGYVANIKEIITNVVGRV